MTAIAVTYVVADWVDLQLVPYCLNDRPLPVATWVYPQQQGLGFPIGSIFKGTFQNPSPLDTTWIKTAIQLPCTFTFADTQQGYVRGNATVTLISTLLTITLTSFVAIGRTLPGFSFY